MTGGIDKMAKTGAVRTTAVDMQKGPVETAGATAEEVLGGLIGSSPQLTVPDGRPHLECLSTFQLD